MIFTCLHFLAGVIRRAIGPRGQVHPTAQECAEDSEPNGLEVTPEETVRIIYTISSSNNVFIHRNSVTTVESANMPLAQLRGLLYWWRLFCVVFFVDLQD